MQLHSSTQYSISPVEKTPQTTGMKGDQRSELRSVTCWLTLCVLLAVTLLLYHDPFLILWWPHKPPEKTKTDGSPLDMATDSIDDMYDGCRSETADVIDQFGVFEWHANKNMTFAWASYEKKAKEPAHERLTAEHAIVMYLYTKVENLRRHFDEEVKNGKLKYGTYGFKYHYFFFYLTDALQVLRQNQTSCRIAYHRTERRFDRDVVHTSMRFGTFVWAPSSKRPFVLKGNVSCFEIYTCFGADITYYSASKHKGQVLVPPYEVFTITDVLTDDPWCNVVYKLVSTKTPRGDLNCKLSQMETEGEAVVTQQRERGMMLMMMPAYLTLFITISLVLAGRRQRRFVAAVSSLLLLMLLLLWSISR